MDVLLDPQEGAERVETELEIFREALLELQAPSSFGCLTRVNHAYAQAGANGKDAYFDLRLNAPEALDTAGAIMDYLEARDFFFKEDSGFATIADELGLDVESTRNQLRTEETKALEAGGLAEVNLYRTRGAFSDVMCKVDAS